MSVETTPELVERAAVLSDCGRYRYRLWRKWADSEHRPILWVMLNPSTADAEIDDPTIRRCMQFSKRWGYGAMWVGNLYAFRSSDPSVLWGMGASEAHGPDNARHLRGMANESALTVCAWGAPGSNGTPGHRDYWSPGGLWCIGRTKDGFPKHPLARGRHRVPDDAVLQRYP